MKQVLALSLMLAGGAFAALIHPFFGILPYYCLSLLRPQALWDYALPEGVRWSLFAAAIAAGGALIHVSTILSRLRWNAVATLLATFAGLVLLSCIMARHPDVAMSRGVEYAKIFFMALLATAVIHEVRHVKWLLMAVFLCIGYVAWEFNARYLFDGRLEILTEGHGGMDSNDISVMLAMGLPLAYAWWRARPSNWTAVFAGSAALVMVHTIMLSYSRSGMVAAVVATGWLAVHHRPRRHVLLMAPLALAAVLYMAGPEVRAEFLSISEYKEDTTAQMRMESWKRGWETAWDHPFTGAGVRNSNLMSEAYGSHLPDRSVHNLYLQVAADSGVIAMAVYIAMVLTAFWTISSFRARSASTPGTLAAAQDDAAGEVERSERFAMALGIEGCLIAFVTGGMFLSLEFFELPWLMFVLAGALPAVARREAGGRRVATPHKSLDDRLLDAVAQQPMPAGRGG